MTAGPAPGVLDRDLLFDADAQVASNDGVAERILVRLGGVAVCHLARPAGGRSLRTLLARDREARAAAAPAVARRIADQVLQLGAPVPGLAIGDAVRMLASPDDAAPPALPSLTIAVCTRDRPGLLADTLVSAARGAGDSDVLVVDNAPSDDRTEALVRTRFPGARYVVEPEVGLSRARNRALRTSTSEVVAFTDDDVVVDAGWATAIRRTFHGAPELATLTGLVAPWSVANPAEAWFEAYGGFGRGYLRRWIVADDALAPLAWQFGNTGLYGTGANLAVRRESALALGGFDAALGAGTPSAGGEDLEFLFRTVKAGAVLAYDPAALIWHRHRTTTDELLAQIESWGSGMQGHLARTVRAYPEERLSAAALTLWLAVAWTVPRLLRTTMDERFPRALIESEWRGSRRGRAAWLRGAAGLGEPAAPRAARSIRREEDVDVDVGQPVEGVQLTGATHVRVRVHRAREPLGTFTVPAPGGMLGAARLRTAIADRFRRDLLGAADDSVLERVLDAIKARSLPRRV
jgi:GT2 family glycosyltransferase